VEVTPGPFSVQRLSGTSPSRIEVVLEGRTLVLRVKRSPFFWTMPRNVEFALSLPRLNRLALSGGSRARLDWQEGPSEGLSVNLSGGSQLTGAWNGGSLDAEISGGSGMTLTGRADPLRLQASGGSWFRSLGFSARGADLGLSGGSRALLSLEGEVVVDASGGSSLEYSGTPTLRQDTSGGAWVKAR